MIAVGDKMSLVTEKETDMKIEEKDQGLRELDADEINFVTGGNGPLSGVPGALPQPFDGGGPLPVGPNPFG